jgi:ParB/RepB/Spo0J family partition protein
MTDTAPSLKTHPGILKRGNQYYIDPKLIVRKAGWNKRFDYGDIEELANSIRAKKMLDGHGVIQGLIVKTLPSGHFEIVDGDRRTYALESLMRKGEVWEFGVPATIVAKDATDAQLRILMMAANTGKDFLPLEEASALKELSDAGMTMKDIAASIGRKVGHVQTTLALLEADTSVQQALKDGVLTTTQAKNLATIKDKDKQKELVAQAKAAGSDKSKKQELRHAVQDVRVAKAKAKGKTIKHALRTAPELADMEKLVIDDLSEKLENADLDKDTDLDVWLIENKSADLHLAFTYGLLVANRVAQGSPEPYII